MVDLDDLAEGLSEFAQPKKKQSRTPVEDRIVSGFEEILRFVEENGHQPSNFPEKDIFERLLAVRLDALRSNSQARELLLEMDDLKLLSAEIKSHEVSSESFDVDELGEALSSDFANNELTQLKHVRTAAEKKAAEEIASRTACQDFEKFEALFRTVRDEISSGQRLTGPFGKETQVEQGDFFIVDGLTAFVASIDAEFFNEGQDRYDARLRVIFSNKTESNLLRTSLQKALHKDPLSRRVARDKEDDLFAKMGSTFEVGDAETGTIYVLRSDSDEDFISKNRQLIHKIGVTGGKIESRIANAKHDATFLLADVEVVRTYKLVGIDRKKLEHLLHRFFSAARIELEIKDRFGNPVKPKEWFLVPLNVIDEVVELLRNGQLVDFVYDVQSASLKKLD
jgi:hypothetical protein